ncbi:MAG TPA: NAD(P)/FAD-dependent oxidoreductase [Thermomicrobiales bacterium]|nr:NAD(P)/FAD-dependent oxidoreductase [Thermomicrobiales bacterium]
MSVAPNAQFDVAIVGGGVAGASLGTRLAQAGLRVAIVERDARFRDRVRGEALHPWGAAEADRLGLTDTLRAVGRPLPIWQRYAERTPLDPYCWADDVPGGYVEWGLSHPALQDALLGRAGAAGAVILRPAIASGVEGGAAGPTLRVRAANAETTLRARLIVAADGRRSSARRWIGAATTVDPPHHDIGGVLLAGVELDRGRAHVAEYPGGMAVVFPQRDEYARAYLVCGTARAAALRSGDVARAIIDACAARLPNGAFTVARPVGPAGFFSCADSWPDRIAGAGVVLIGDAAGANDPSRGHGLSLAFRDARLLGDLLLGGADWRAAIAEFARARSRYYATLRAHAMWQAALTIDEGDAADAARARAERSRAIDPSAGGFAGIYAFGADGLAADDTARRHFFGEDLPDG